MIIRDARGSLIRFTVFAVLTVFATLLLASTITTIGAGSGHEFRAVFSDATGLLPGDDVRIAGVRAGEVTELKVNDHGHAEVGISVRKDRPLTRSTRVLIRYRNLIGGRYVELIQGTGNGAPLEPGAVIPLSQTQPAANLTALFNGFKPLFAALSPDDVNTVSAALIKTLQGEGGTMKSLIAHTASLTGTIADRDQVIGELITNLNGFLATLDERDEQFSDMVLQLQRLVSGLAADRDAIGSSLVHLDSVSAATADLLRDIRPAVDEDIERLASVAGTLEENNAVLDDIFKRLPNDLNTITRTASYGSWFNFYLCDLDGWLRLPNGQILTPEIHVTHPRCAK